MKNASPNWPYLRVGVSSVASSWNEGTVAKEYTEVPGAPCYDQAELGKRDWANPGSTVRDVVLGRGHTVWIFADCTKPKAGRRWRSTRRWSLPVSRGSAKSGRGCLSVTVNLFSTLHSITEYALP